MQLPLFFWKTGAPTRRFQTFPFGRTYSYHFLSNCCEEQSTAGRTNSQRVCVVGVPMRCTCTILLLQLGRKDRIEQIVKFLVLK
jgi:hypothetical protein